MLVPSLNENGLLPKDYLIAHLSKYVRSLENFSKLTSDHGYFFA